MSLTIDLESVDGICIGIVKGPLTLDDIKECAAKMWQLVEASKVRILWDLRDANFDLEVAEVSELAEAMKRLHASADPRVAFVLSQDLEFGLVRMYEAFRQSDGRRTSAFRCKDKAIAWLSDASL